MLATGSADKTVKLWDTSTGNEIRTLVAHAGAITSVAFSPEGRWLASASLDKSVILWEVSSGNQLQKLTGHTERVNAVAFSPDGRLLASVSDDKTALLWDPQNGNLVRTLSGSVSRIAALAFSPDGTVLATGSLLRLGFHVNRQGEIRLWKVESGALDGSFERIFGNVRGLAFSPDGRTLASAEDFAQASSNSVITFWDVRKQTVLSQYDAERRGQLYAIAYSPDGRWLATGGHSGRIRFWQ